MASVSNANISPQSTVSKSGTPQDGIPITNVTSNDRSSRIDVLDSLRGFALLGILVMNIQSFAMPSQAYFNPFAWGNDGGDLFNTNGIVYLITHTLFDQKFMTIFSLLFGVSMSLMVASYKNKQAMINSSSVSTLHFLLRRNLFLLFIGLVHAYLIWEGDILVSYALCGFFVIWFRNKSIKVLLSLGAGLFLVPVILSLLVGVYVPETVINSELQKDWTISSEELRELKGILAGSWFQLFIYRMSAAFEIQTWLFSFYTFWRVSALMIWGMVIYNIGLFSKRIMKKCVFICAFILIPIGLIFVGVGIQQNNANQWQAFYSHLFGAQFNYIGSAILGIGYIFAFVLLAPYFPFRLNYFMQCIGRTALSNYFLQSLICGLIFYGYGLDLFVKLDRLQLLLLVPFIWVLQIIFSLLWLRFFRMGPIEWLWRTAVFKEVITLRKYKS